MHLCKKIEQVCQAATFVSDAMLRVNYQVAHFQVFISYPLTNFSMVMQTTEVTATGLKFPGSCILPFL